jgi:hypothetical protein
MPAARRKSFALYGVAIALTALLQSMAAPAAASESDEYVTNAETAWTAQRYDDAERQFRILIERGKLDPDGVVNAYVKLGAARAYLNKRKEATAAFRAAAVLRADFTVPAGSEAKTSQLADAARAEMAAIGSVRFGAKFPEAVRSGEGVTVATTLDEAHVAVVSRISVRVRIVGTDRAVSRSQPAAIALDFVIPAENVTGPGELVLEAFAEDKFGNALGVSRAQLTLSGNLLVSGEATPKPPAKPGKSFWATPWPYIGLGVLAVGGGALGYYYGLRPTDSVNVLPVRVTTR